MTKRILIVGGGIGGLTAAACLQRSGFDVALFEQSPDLGEVGAGIQLSANAMHVLNDIGIGGAIDCLSVRPKSYVFATHDTFDVIHEFPLADDHFQRHGAPFNQIHRADLHKLLAERVRSENQGAIQVAKKAIGFHQSPQGVTVEFSDGSSAQGDVLIGADGLKSTIRAPITGDVPAAFTGDVAWRITVRADRLPADLFDKSTTVLMGPATHAVVYWVRSGALLNFVGIVETNEISEESWTERYPWERLKSDFSQWGDRVQTILDACDRDRCFRWALFTRSVSPIWSKDRVTLMGDAVHATLPYLAQGAAMAIEDAAILTRSLVEFDNPQQALSVYQNARIQRTARIVAESAANRSLFHHRSPEARNAAFANRNMGGERNNWLYSYNPMTIPLTS